MLSKYRQKWHQEFQTSLLLHIVKFLDCSICLQVMHVPFVVGCGHSFCQRCIELWLKQTKSCPICRMVTKYPPIPSILLRDVGELIVGLTMDSIRDQKKKMTPQTLKNFQMDGSNVAQTGGKMSTHMFESQTWTDGGSASPHTLFEESTSADHSYEVATSDIVQDIVSEGFLEAYVTPSGSDDTELHPESDHVNDSDSDYAYGSVGGSVGDSVDDHYDRYGWDHDGDDYDYEYDNLYWC